MDNEKTQEQVQAELDALMSEYTQPAKVVEGSLTENKEIKKTNSEKPISPTNQPVINTQPNNGSAPYGYLKNGKPRKTPPKNFNPSQVVQQPTQKLELKGTLIDAGIFLSLINLVIPLLITLIANRFSKDKVKPDHLRLTGSQIKDLDPIVDAVLKDASVTANPKVLLIIGLFTAFGMNYLGAVMNSKTEKF